jgi:uncharacterized protein (TIGR03437 family)
LSRRPLIMFAILAYSLPIVAFADVTGSPTLQATTALNLDTGATSGSGGDLLWNGTILTPQGTAGIFNFLVSGSIGPTLYASITQQQLSVIAVGNYKMTGLGGASLAVGVVFGVHTNGGNYAKVLVTSNSGGSLGLQFTTFGASGGGGGGGGGAQAPTITAVENAATNIPPGLPNAAIAQGSMFVVKGTNLGPATIAIATTFPLTTSRGGTSITVTVGSTTVDAVMYYSLAAQVAAILPSKTPTGTGTVKVTYNGQSATAPIVVVQSNIGIFTLSTTGTGDAVAFSNVNNGLLTPTNAANAGDAIIFWGTGLGPVTSDETQPAVQADLTNVPVQVFIGGQPAKILFRGRNACCSSVDTVYVTVPDGLSGCAVSVIMQIGNIVSNTTTIPVAASGRTCTPVSANPSTGTGSAPHSFGGFSLERIVETIAAIGPSPASTIKMDIVGGSFEKVTPASNPPQGSQIDINSYGSCTVSTAVSGQAAPPPSNSGSVQWLDAGQITVAGPGISGSVVLGRTTTGGVLVYQTSLDNTATTLAAGTYTFTGAGGPDVGPFTANYNMPPPFTWTNQASLATVNRASGATVTWSGGDPAGYVTIAGNSTFYGTTGAQSVSVSFTCTARVSDGSFTVPPIVLLALPPSAPITGTTITVPGTLIVTNVSSFTSTFQASGIDLGAISSAFIYGGSATYQ